MSPVESEKKLVGGLNGYCKFVKIPNCQSYLLRNTFKKTFINE